MSQLFNGDQDYSPKVVNEAASALHCQTWELLMPPEEAMALRRFRETAREVVRSDPAKEIDPPGDAPGRDGTNG